MRLKIAALLAASLCAATGATAATVLTQTQTATPGAASSTAFIVNDPANVAGATTASTSTVLIAPVALSQFNPTTGILVGARVSATIPVTISTVVYFTGGTGGGGTNVSGTTTYVGGVSAAGVSATSAATALTQSHSCSGGNCSANDAQNTNNTRTSGAATYSASGAVASASLSSYYGTNATGVAVSTAGTLTVSSTGTGANITSGTTAGIVNRTAGSSYSVAYDYLNFSSPSFNGSSVVRTLDLNFGTVHQANGLTTRNFTLFNIGNANSAGFDLISLDSNGNSLFTTTLAPFSGQTNNIDGGQSRTFSVSLTPSSLGSKVEQFRLVARDSAADVGDGVGAQDYALTLNIFATVLPEPGTWVSMIFGFGLIGAASRRRRRTVFAAA